MTDLSNFQNLAIATAIGFIVGFEREWREATTADEHFAGARTFALIGLAGGAAGIIGGSGLVIAAGILAAGALVAVAYWLEARVDPTTGATTETAFLATFLLGALATRGEPALAAAGGVVAAILLAVKPSVVAAAKAIERKELFAALRFLAISVIILPLAPDEPFGPLDALNPRRIWLFVVLISGLSFVGYWLIKLFGARGVLLTGLVGGLASSTATTLSISRLMRSGAAAPIAGAAGIVAANVVMLARVAALLFVAGRSVLAEISMALLAAGLVGAAAALLLARRGVESAGGLSLGNPLELRPALFFAALLAGVTLASRYMVAEFGEEGFLVLAFVAGLADLDAVTLSAATEAGAGAVTAATAGASVLIALAANMLVKSGMVIGIARGRGAVATFAAFVLMAGAGAATLALP
jgi:uncharacterized membrane protein (DUF4010 family)